MLLCYSDSAIIIFILGVDVCVEDRRWFFMILTFDMEVGGWRLEVIGDDSVVMFLAGGLAHLSRSRVTSHE